MCKRKIRILQVIGGLNMGGAETFLMNILRNIDRNKYQFIFLCYGNKHFDYEDEAISLGAKIIRISLPKKVLDLAMIFNIKKIIINEKIDIVHIHTYYNSMYAVLAAKAAKVKEIIVHSHSTKSEPNPNLAKRIYFKIAKIIINKYSTTLLACGKEAGGAFFTKEFQIINNGIELEKFRYSEEARKNIRKELRIEGDEILIGHVGRLEPVKNHQFMIELIKRLSEYNSKYKMIFIGDGSLRKKIEQDTKKMNINDKVIFAGKRKDVNKIYSAMDLFIFPSLFEGLPVSLIEAQVSGLQVIASDNIDKKVNIVHSMLFLSNNQIEEWIINIQNYEPKNRNINEKYFFEYDIRDAVAKLEKIYAANGCNNVKG